MRSIYFLLILLVALEVEGQVLPVARNIQKAFRKGTRSMDGRPGERYWQNTADYDLSIDFDPTSLFLQGKEAIVYTNNSPDTLRKLVVKLYPNIYKEGAVRLMPVAPNDESTGVSIDRISLEKSSTELGHVVEGTNMVVGIPPLAPKQSLTININYHYTLNKGSHLRTGQVDEGSSFVAYFFPRIAVYDDLDGWNNYPYLGTAEFYNDFCNFNVSVKLPKKYMVWATGDLLNCNEVFNKKYCDRIRKAEQSDEISSIIDTNDLKEGNITVGDSLNSWRFKAKNVTDFVFAVSDHYVWQSSSLVVDQATGRRTRADAVFNPEHKGFFEVSRYNRETVSNMSFRFPKWPFPYPHITVFDGLDQMEYPMMVNDNPTETPVDDITLTDHEVFHTMFPFYMGINETKYGWMDEGWATIGEWLVSPMIDSTIDDDYGMDRYNANAGKEVDFPVTALTVNLDRTSAFLSSYVKPALGYLFVKDYLGDSLFFKGLHYYISQWKGKHPMPYDFFNCMNIGSGKDLNWFWNRWFFEGGVPDLAIDKVKKSVKGYTVMIKSKGEKPVPINLKIKFADGTTLTEHRNIGVWNDAKGPVTMSINATKPISSISLGDTHDPDINRADNVWIAGQK